MSLLVLLVFASSMVLQLTKVRATTLTWTSNADFQMNKVSECNEIELANLILSSQDYTDTTCQSTETDANLSLQTSGTNLTDIKMISSGPTHSLALKNDGTVWSWGVNNYGQLGDGSQVNTELATQVKDPSGEEFLTGIISSRILGMLIDLCLNYMVEETGAEIKFTIFSTPLTLVLLTIIAVVMVGFIVSILPARRAKHINAIEVLRKE